MVNKGYIHSETHNRHISQARVGMKFTPLHRKNLSKAKTGPSNRRRAWQIEKQFLRAMKEGGFYRFIESAQSVCDFIAVGKRGAVYLIEIKSVLSRNRPSLKPKQRIAKKIFGKNYIVLEKYEDKKIQENGDVYP